jgi:hypothetical protein
MRVAYVDDAGDIQTISTPDANIQPVLAFATVVLPVEGLNQLTRDFLALKRRFFGGRMRSPHLLDDVLVEIKGAELREMVRSPSRRRRRRAIRFLDELLGLLEANDAKVMGRVWIKALGEDMNGQALNTFSIQAIAETFQAYLTEIDDEGWMIIDSSTPGMNAAVSHSIFTAKFRAAGDQYDRLLELPTFGHSKNHVGLQIADILSSGLVTPMACRTYCCTHVTGVHVHVRYDEIKSRFGVRVQHLQFRYVDGAGTWRGGFTVSDPVNRLHSGHLFR